MKTKRPRRLRERSIAISELASVRLLDMGGAKLVERVVDHLKRIYPTVDVKKGHWARQRLLLGEMGEMHLILHPWQSGQMLRAVICIKEEADLMVANALQPHGAVMGVSPLHRLEMIRRRPEWDKLKTPVASLPPKDQPPSAA